MLKTIKTTKQMRLDELIKYVWNNGITNRKFQGNYFKHVEINEAGEVRLFMQETPIFSFDKHNTFTVEIEEPITEYTSLERVVYVHKNKTLIKDFNTSVDEILNSKHEGSVSEIYALIDGRLELAWERDDGISEELKQEIENNVPGEDK